MSPTTDQRRQCVYYFLLWEFVPIVLLHGGTVVADEITPVVSS